MESDETKRCDVRVCINLCLLRDESVCATGNKRVLLYGQHWVLYNITLSEYVTACRESLNSYETLYASRSVYMQAQRIPEL